MKEDARTKGLRLLMDGRLIVRKVDGDFIHAECRGDSGEIYSLGYDPWKKEWRCGCQARTKCSHLWALTMVTVIQRPENGAPSATGESRSPAATAAPATSPASRH